MSNCILRRYLSEIASRRGQIPPEVADDDFREEKYVLLSETNEIIASVHCGPPPTIFRNPNQNFLFIPTISPFSRTQEMMRLKIAGAKVGWVIPLVSFIERNESIEAFREKLEDAAIFTQREIDSRIERANAAIDEVLLGILKNEECINFAVIPEGVEHQQDLDITDFYSDDTVVVLLDKHWFMNTKPRAAIRDQEYIDAFKSLILLNGYVPVTRSHRNFLDHIDWEHTKASLALRTMSFDLKDIAQGISWILSNAFMEPTAAGTFLGLYQVIEALKLKSFRICLEIVRTTDSISIDQYALKEFLTDLSRDKKQLTFLFHNCWRQGGFGSLLSSLERSCNNFLDTLDISEADGPVDSLFKVRNQIVHHRLTWENNSSAELVLHDVNRSLRELLLIILSKFSTDHAKTQIMPILHGELIG